MNEFKKRSELPQISASEMRFDYDPTDNSKRFVLGCGISGCVYTGIYQNHPVVIKTLDETSDAMKHQFISDARIQYSIQSAYVVSLLGVMEKDALVEERMATTLHQYLKDHKALTWVARYRIAYEILQGLCLLHDQSIIHKNLTSRNVLLDAQDHVKLGDVGLLVHRSSVHRPAYISPELYQLDFSDSEEECKEPADAPSHTFASDVYAYGVLLWELATGKAPFLGKNWTQIQKRVMKGKHEKIPETCPEEFAQIIKDCWQSNPSDRPTMASLMERVQGLYGGSLTRHFDPILPVPTTQGYGLRTAYEVVLPPQGLLDVQKVFHAYQLSPVPGYDIAKVEVIHNPDLEKAFAVRISVLASHLGNPDFAPTWEQQAEDTPEQKSWRARIIQRFSKWARPHTDPVNPHIYLLPLWHGTHPDLLSSVFTRGYDTLPQKGIHSAVEASYAHQVYSKGALILNWVALGSPYPVIDGDLDTSEGRAHDQRYDGHFMPICPKDPNDSKALTYGPCTPHQAATHHEVVVFNGRQCLPRYLVTLQPRLPLSVERVHIPPLYSHEVALTKRTKRIERTVQEFSWHPDFSAFLHHVAYGNQDEAEALLKKTPGLVLGRGDVTDYSQRTFYYITALQYAIWSLDAYMYTMMIPYFKKIQLSHVMGEQSIEWRGASQAYLGNAQFPMKEGRDYFDYGPSLEAYTTYIHRWEALYEHKKWHELEQLWGKIGQQQFHWPAHFALEMTTPDRPLYPLDQVDFNQRKRPTRQTDHDTRWMYRELGVRNKCLLVYRGERPKAESGVEWSWIEEAVGREARRLSILRDSSAMTKMYTTRVNNIRRLRSKSEGLFTNRQVHKGSGLR